MKPTIIKRKNGRLRILSLCFLFILSACIVSGQKRHNGKISNSTIEVYVSSEAGDRLSRKKDGFFTNGHRPRIPTIIVQDDTLYQRIEGFGATFNEAGLICLNDLSPNNQQKVLASLFDSVKGAGFTFMKSPVAACDFASAGPWYSYDDHPGDTLMKYFSIQRDIGPNGLITFIKKASAFGRFRIESPMDFAPDWMYFSLKPGEKNIQPKYYRALALYYSKFLQAYEGQGVHIDFLNLFNEADNEWYSNETYKEIGEMIKGYVGPQLRTDGLNTQIQFGETANRPEAIQKFASALDDPELRPYIHSLTVHGYDWNKFSTLTELHKRYPQLPIYQTEVCYAKPNNIPPGGPHQLPVYAFSDGSFWGNMIINDLKNWASGWIYWNMILDQNGGPWLVSPEHGDPDHNQQHPVVIIDRKNKKVHYTGLYYYLAHFSRFIRPGAYRIASTGDNAQLNAIAVKNADGSIILNIINNGAAMNCRVSWKNEFSVQRLPAHSITTLKWKDYSALRSK